MSIPRRVRRFFASVVRRLRPRALPPLSFAAIALATAACISPMSPAQKLNDAVQEANNALQFGRTDIAIERVSPPSRAAFIKQHKMWGAELRIVDVQLGGLEKMDGKEAIVLVGFSWFRPTDGMLRTTIVRQTWKNDDGSGPWALTREERASGDLGLLGEVNIVVVSPEKKDVHFDTKVIPGK